MTRHGNDQSTESDMTGHGNLQVAMSPWDLAAISDLLF